MRAWTLLCLTFVIPFMACSSMVTPPPAPETTQAAPPPPPEPPPVVKKRVLVLKVLNRSQYPGTALVDQIYRETQRGVKRASDTVVVPQEEIAGFENFTFDDLSYDMKAIFTKARQNSIAGIVLGFLEDISVTEGGEESGLFRTQQFHTSARVSLQFLDVMTEREVATETNEATAVEETTSFFTSRAPAAEDGSQAKEAVSKALEPLITRFPTHMKRFEWMGRIARIERHRYYINAGEESGLLKGQLLKVSGESFAVEDPATGNLIGNAPGTFKGLLKVIDYLGRDGSIAVLHSGGGIREQDVVEIFSPK